MLSLALLVVLSHGVTLFSGFVFDDRFIIVDNPYLENPGSWGRFFTESSWSGAGYETDNYRPLPMTTFAWNHALHGLRPFGYHLVNVSLQLLNVLLLFLLARRLGWSLGGAWLAAAIFAVHPMTCEPVSEIVGRMDLMAGGAILGAVLLHFLGQGEELPKSRRSLALVGSTGLFVLALLSKEHAIAFPAIALTLDLAWKRSLRSPRSILIYGAYLILSLSYLALRVALFGSIAMAKSGFDPSNVLSTLDYPKRLVSALWISGLYLKHFVWPLGLSPDYSYAQILPLDSVSSPGAVITWFTGLLCLIAVIASSLRSRRAAAALAIAIFPFLPVSNTLIPIGTIMGERLFYLSVAGLSLIVGIAWENLRSTRNRLAMVVAAILLLSLGGLTIRLNLQWRSDFSLDSYAVKVAPKSARIRSNLGHDLLELGQLESAKEQFQIAEEILPNEYRSTSGLAKVALRLGNYQEAIQQANRALALASDPVESLALLAEAKRLSGNSAAAREAWSQILQHDPSNSSALSNLAIAAWQEGRHDRAVELWEKAAEAPDAPGEIWMNLGLAYDQLDRPEEAIRAYHRFLESPTGTEEQRQQVGARLKKLD